MRISMTPVRTAAQFDLQRTALASRLLDEPIFDRGEVHAQKVVDESMRTRELRYVDLTYDVPEEIDIWQARIRPNMPWAEDHFRERVSGEPLNPPPSNEWWPYNRNKNADHKGEDEQFSHTYPERFWPRAAGLYGRNDVPSTGIRFRLGDLDDLIEVLAKNPRSRQAYLPIWFPEDLAAAAGGERVPCTLGYHFMLNPQGELDCSYPMRSCDFLRFMVDDIYMAGRLVHWLAANLGDVKPGTLYMNISSLHVFQGDTRTLEKMIEDDEDESWLGGISG